MSLEPSSNTLQHSGFDPENAKRKPPVNLSILYESRILLILADFPFVMRVTAWRHRHNDREANFDIKYKYKVSNYISNN
jgi:hypothetical protein